MNEEKKKAWEEYFQLSAEMVEEELEYYKNHWVNDHLHTPETLINIVDTRIARAVVAERTRIYELAKQWISEAHGHDGECDCERKTEMLENFINHDEFHERKQ